MRADRCARLQTVMKSSCGWMFLSHARASADCVTNDQCAHSHLHILQYVDLVCHA